MDGIVLHVGASKCGSSALQAAFSESPLLTGRNGRTLAYAAVLGGARLLTGQRLSRKMGVRGRRTSVGVEQIANFNDDQMSRIRSELNRISADVVVLSNEGWIGGSKGFRQILPRLGIEPHVVIYVRPQVSWLNSSWWQWGAWSDVDLKTWVDRRLPYTHWARTVDIWRSLPGVSSVTVRLFPKDIVADFCSVVRIDGLDRSVFSDANRGLPASVLRLYQRNRCLRPEPHRSAIDSVIARHVRITGATPWVMTSELTDLAISSCRQSNLELLELLDAESAEQMQNDPEWWDASAFAHKELEPWEPQAPDPSSLEELCVELTKALYKLEVGKS